MNSACRDDRESVLLFSFWAVEIFFSCTLYDITIILCCLLGFRPSLDRASTLLKMIEDVTEKVPIKVPGELFW